MRRVVAALAAPALLSGCGGAAAHEDAVRGTAESWTQAVRDGEWQEACAALASGTIEELEQSEQKPCAEALRTEQPPVGSGTAEVSVYGQQAQVAYRGETLFLAQFPSGWRVWAAACSEPAAADLPFDCSISGG